MTLAADIAGDYTIFDGVETVTVTPQNPTATALATVQGLKRATRFSDVAAGAGLGVSTADVNWHLWVSTLGVIVPKAGDLITQSNGAVWTILMLSLDTLGTRWRCTCRKRAS